MNSEVLRNIGGRGARGVTAVLQGEGRGHFCPKSALSMAPNTISEIDFLARGLVLCWCLISLRI